jgi:hypothetical protein
MEPDVEIGERVERQEIVRDAAVPPGLSRRDVVEGGLEGDVPVSVEFLKLAALPALSG